jgi:hypothetical protein
MDIEKTMEYRKKGIELLKTQKLKTNVSNAIEKLLNNTIQDELVELFYMSLKHLIENNEKVLKATIILKAREMFIEK